MPRVGRFEDCHRSCENANATLRASAFPTFAAGMRLIAEARRPNLPRASLSRSMSSGSSLIRIPTLWMRWSGWLPRDAPWDCISLLRPSARQGRSRRPCAPTLTFASHCAVPPRQIRSMRSAPRQLLHFLVTLVVRLSMVGRTYSLRTVVT